MPINLFSSKAFIIFSSKTKDISNKFKPIQLKCLNYFLTLKLRVLNTRKFFSNHSKESINSLFGKSNILSIRSNINGISRNIKNRDISIKENTSFFFITKHNP